MTVTTTLFLCLMMPAPTDSYQYTLRMLSLPAFSKCLDRCRSVLSSSGTETYSSSTRFLKDKPAVLKSSLSCPPNIIALHASSGKTAQKSSSLFGQFVCGYQKSCPAAFTAAATSSQPSFPHFTDHSHWNIDKAFRTFIIYSPTRNSCHSRMITSIFLPIIV